MTEHAHPSTEHLQEAMDGRLPAAARADIDAHLQVCPQCRQEFAALSWVKHQTREGVRATALPLDLERALVAALDAEDGRRAAGTDTASTARPAIGRRAWLGALAAAAGLAAIWVWPRRGTESVPAQVADDFRAYEAGVLTLDVRTSDVSALESRLRAGSLAFTVRVFDFGMMNYRLTGGGFHHVAGQPSALSAYDGPDASRVVCQMYAGSADELPRPDERRQNDGIDFLVYRRGGVTLAFWQEGRVVCVLATNLDVDGAVALAFAKAVRG